MIKLTQEQQRAYDRFIRARNKVGLVRTKDFTKQPYIPTREYTTVEVAGLNHPLFERNDEWFEYLEASKEWWAIEPELRKAERMSAIRGDYGASDSWNEEAPRVRDTYSILQEEE
jgi:hypothetical protein